MRLFVFLLILANLLFFAWTRDYFGLPGAPDASRASQQLRADQLRIVSNDQPPPPPPRTEKAAKPVDKAPVEFCTLLNEMAATEADQLEKQLTENFPALRVARTTTPGSSSHWIHIPPLKSKRDAENKAAELKKLGVKEFFIVQENSANNLAISLGLFSTPEAAEAALEALREKGVKTARINERPLKPAVAQLEIRGMETQPGEVSRFLGQAAPNVRTSICKSRNAPGQ